MTTIYLIPAPLQEEGMQTIPGYITDAIKDCQVFFVENERTTRRFFKQLWKTRLPQEEIVIDHYEWFTISENAGVIENFKKKIKEGKNIGIVSEAGCPGVADPGQRLVGIAHEMKAVIKPLVGPSSILLALMASGMNGQEFRFVGYIPIDNQLRIKAGKELEAASVKNKSTQLIIETPYRNNQLFDVLLKHCHPSTKICVAVDLTGKNEWIKTKTVAEWQQHKPDIHKRPALFLLQSR
jgi:16S rRNA (cytidine1402-2'-O)-methyltransferase